MPLAGWGHPDTKRKTAHRLFAMTCPPRERVQARKLGPPRGTSDQREGRHRHLGAHHGGAGRAEVQQVGQLPEFIAKAVREWFAKLNVRTLFVEPGGPWQSGFGESFNGKLRDELLACELFHFLAEAKWLAEEYRIQYDTVRAHASLGEMTPAEFASQCGDMARESVGALDAEMTCA